MIFDHATRKTEGFRSRTAIFYHSFVCISFAGTHILAAHLIGAYSSGMEKDEKLKDLRDKCLTNAEALLSVAERELGKSVDHICFHLALLALEEVGKATLITVSTTVAIAGKEKKGISVAMDDHVKKIFWALWGGLFRGEKFTKESIEQNRDLASGLHNHRLFYLYTDPNNPLPPEEKMRDGEARTLVELVRARLELEKLTEIKKFEEGDVENLTWFFTATEDPEKRKHIFGGVSMTKFAELADARKWMEWLREGFQKNEDEMRKLGEQELSRERPVGDEAYKPKYKMRIRLQSPSHTVKGNAFDKWNAGVHDIKLYKSDRKGVSETTKSEFLVDFTFPKALNAATVWEHGFFMSKTMAIAFNIATRGVFWWNVAKDLEKYYEEITDIEADPKGSIKIRIIAGKRLAINWDDVHLSLGQEEMSQVSMVAGYLMRNGEKLKDCLIAYATALAVLSKIDIHLRMEPNAFEQFWLALKCALVVYGDWDGTSDVKEAIKKQYEKIGEMSDLEKTVDLAIALDLDEKKQRMHPITLTEVIAMKLYCDYYLILKINEYFKSQNPEIPEKDGVEKPSEHGVL